MMKIKVIKLLSLVFVCFFITDVFANSKDIEAKYDIDYNVDLVSADFNNESKNMVLGDLKLEVSTSLSNVQVIVIKASGKANEYASNFTNNTVNYYLMVYINNQKASSSNVKIKILNKDKSLSIYDNKGNIIDKTSDLVTLTKNNYFLTISDKLDTPDINYTLVDDGNTVTTIDDIDIPNNSDVKVYNSKGIQVSNTVNLGTNYNVVVNSDNAQSKYTIIVKGDTTGDAKVNLNDVTRLYHNYKGIEEMDEVYILAGDVAKNQIINLNDITKLYHYYKKIIPRL